jgi:hypothetical protein
VTRPGRYAGTAPRPFLAVTVPALLACLALGVAAVVGWLPVSVVSARPLEVGTSAGAADALRIRAGTEELLTGRSAEGPHASAMIRVDGAELEDLCLVPRVRLPLVGAVSLSLRSLAPVAIDHVELAASDTRLADLTLPRTRVGGRLDPADGPALARTSGEEGGIGLGGLRMQSHGLLLTEGLDVRGLRLRAVLGEGLC